MNFLDLVQTLAAEAGTVSPADITDVADYASGSGPDEHVADLVRWIRQSDREIQLQRDDWRFRSKEGQLYLDPGDGDYDARQQIKDYYKVFPFSQGNRYIRINDDFFPVRYVPYRKWAGNFDFRRRKTRASRPTHFTMAPDNRIKVYPTPAEASLLHFEYVRTPCMMTFVNECEPIIPVPFRMLIVYKALMKHAMHDEAQAQAQRAQIEYNALIIAMRNDQVPEIGFSIG